MNIFTGGSGQFSLGEARSTSFGAYTSGIHLMLVTFVLVVVTPQLLQLGALKYWSGGVQGLVVTRPDAPSGLPMSQDTARSAPKPHLTS